MRFTGRAEGDLGIDGGPGLAERRTAVVPEPWSWLRQVHGATVHRVDRPGAVRGVEGDALVGGRGCGALATFTADCAPIALASADGVIGAVHAGWRGLAEGVIGRAIEEMRALGASRIVAALGPCIRVGCYEFGAEDLDLVARRLGDEVVGRTESDRPALDLAAGVRVALARAGVEELIDGGWCTACDSRFYSYRARGEPQRQATVVTWT